MSPTTRFILISLVFHLLYTASIFDIYFTSPVVHPARRFSPLNVNGAQSESLTAPAERLVLIVGDGLRADTLFKHHPSNVLPAWAQDEIVRNGKLSVDTALRPDKNWTRTNVAESIGSFDAAPFLRHAALQRGAWGISHTRVPTESRPGHVALIAGMYEDVSAVTKGWKLNPVSFDSLFNQSSSTFSFGSPDILPMFAIGATPGRVYAESYAEEAEDFTADATKLDTWVLDRLRNLLNSATHNATLDAQLRSPGTVFFLHLLGLDTTGHTYRPHSTEYVGNLMVVDAIASETERILSEFYGKQASEKTAFVFSADHGMSNKGNHGDGEPDNTRTPLVVWGAGVRKPKGTNEVEQEWREEQRKQDSFYQAWGALDHTRRQDVEQADITPLMSSLLGLNVPANSEGRLPSDYLNISKEYAAHAIFANAMEVLEVYRVKHAQRKQRMIRYVPYKELHSDDERLPGEASVELIRNKLSSSLFDQAIVECEDLIAKALHGAQYLQTYDWLLLVGIIVTGYIGSMMYSITFLLRHHVLSREKCADLERTPSRLSLGRIVVGSALASLWAKFAAEQAPWTYYMYAGFAAFYWIRVFDAGHILSTAFRLAEDHYSAKSHISRPKLAVATSILSRLAFTLVALEVMVIGYMHRIAWSAGFVVLGFIWPAVGILADVKSRHELLMIAWFILCALCSLFTIGNVEKEESVPFLVFSGVLFLVAGLVVVGVPVVLFSGTQTDAERKQSERTRSVLKVQIGVLIVSTIVTASSSFNLQQKKGLPRLNQVLAWLILAICLTVPFAYGFGRSQSTRSDAAHVRQAPSQRLAIVVFAFAPIFVLLSIRDETVFFGCYTLLLLAWAKLEASLYEERTYAKNVQRQVTQPVNGTRLHDQSMQTGRALEKEDVRMAVCYLFFLHVGFFGTGNIASISSFYLSPVYRLVPIFSPFLMATLLLLKILVPFVVLASVLQTLCLTPAHEERTSGLIIRKTGKQLAGPPFFGTDTVGGLGMKDAYGLVLLACLFTDVLALNFLLTVQTQGSWLEIGRSITHFAMSNLLQVFILTLSAVADFVVGRGRTDVVKVKEQ